jgi:sigma-B regulation protein RsbU (phosphoserine phosphatase)
MNKPEADSQRVHDLQCMEIWNGNRHVERDVHSAGLQAWVFSQPYQSNRQGGDIHYLSLCVGGIVTRIVLADVAGHGDQVAKTSKELLNLLRKFMNTKKQDRLVAELNRHFTEIEAKEGFATAIVATYLSHKSTLLLTNAGHPRPLFYGGSNGRWEFLDLPTTEKGLGENFPFGLDQATRYEHFVLKIEPGDWLLLYTDAYTECCDTEERLLGESGLLKLVQQIPRSLSVTQFGRELNRLLSGYSSQWLSEDDTTLIAIQFTKERRTPGLLEKLGGYIKVVRRAVIS